MILQGRRGSPGYWIEFNKVTWTGIFNEQLLPGESIPFSVSPFFFFFFLYYYYFSIQQRFPANSLTTQYAVPLQIEFYEFSILRFLDQRYNSLCLRETHLANFDDFEWMNLWNVIFFSPEISYLEYYCCCSVCLLLHVCNKRYYKYRWFFSRCNSIFRRKY